MKYIVYVLLFVGTFCFPNRHAMSDSESAALKEDMRKLWSDHVIWTRQYIVSSIAKIEDAPVVVNRLMKNQEDIGNAISPYYGDDSAKKLTSLLQEHIAIAADVVTAAIKNDKESLKTADKKWHENADKISDFLSTDNPYLSKKDLQKMFYKHLELTTKEATLRINQKWKEDISNFDKIFDQILSMSDDIANSIIKEFKKK